MDELARELLLVDRTGDDRDRADALRRLVDVDVADWLDLDAALRRVWSERRGRERVLPRLTRGDGGVLLALLAASHPDGHLREAAVVRLATEDDPVVLAALALRTGDWVPQVRDRARAATAARLASVDTMLGVGPVAVLLAARARGGWLRASFDTAVAALDDDDVARLLTAADPRVRRAAFGVALDNDRLAPDVLLDAARHDADLVVRTRCAAVAIRTARDTGRLEPLRVLTASGTASIRAEAVWALAAVGDTGPAVTALFDRSPSVREVAQTAVRRAGEDPAARYRARIEEPGVDPAVVAGLGECGGDDSDTDDGDTGDDGDATAVARHLTDRRTRVRREAVRALRRLGAVDMPVLARMLDDPSGAVVRQVVTALLPHAAAVDKRLLADRLDPSVASHVRLAAYRLLRARDVWTRLLTDLELWDDEAFHGRVRADLLGWLRDEAATTYSTPPAAARDEFDRLLARAGRSLGAERSRVLRFHLGLAGRG